MELAASTRLSRSAALSALASAGVLFRPMMSLAAGNDAAACAKPETVGGVRTCANVAAAQKEGTMVGYSADADEIVAAFQQKFQAAFPKIDASQYVRLASGRLHTKLLQERQAGIYTPDTVITTDCGLALDFQRRGGFVRYLSPELAAYDRGYQSDPPGYWTQSQLQLIGIAYNSAKVSDADAPKSFKDLTNPRWKGKLGLKDASSGSQQIQWYVLRKLYGDKYWQDIAALQPRAVASVSQQYQRLLDGEDMVVGMAGINDYLKLAAKQKDLPIKFVYPAEGIIYNAHAIGVADHAPHPEAAKLFVDFMLSPGAQQQYTNLTGYYSPLASVAPPPGGRPLPQIKILRPDSWANVAAAVETQFSVAWRSVVGL